MPTPCRDEAFTVGVIYIQENGKYLSLDNRRLYCLKAVEWPRCHYMLVKIQIIVDTEMSLFRAWGR